jgi:hypothetical protein
VEADFSVELASDDERLEVPWAAPDGSLQYFDLRAHPELITQIEEAQREPALTKFLTRLNAVDSMLQSAKCDTWLSNDISPEEEIFGLAQKYGCYIDLFFVDERRFSFPAYEQLATHLTQLLKKAPGIPVAAELLIRRCHFHEAADRDGFYVTSYVFGFGDDEQSARQQWQIGLQLLENAMRQCAR